MKVLATYIVFYLGRKQVLYYCDNDCYYISANGAFNQRETTIEDISDEDAKNLIG